MTWGSTGHVLDPANNVDRERRQEGGVGGGEEKSRRKNLDYVCIWRGGEYIGM